MQFVVPQFIDVEDKILGPLSVRQFIMCIVASGMIIAAFRFADFPLFILETFVTVVLLILFAFMRVNGRPFHHFLFNLLQNLRKPKLRVWRRIVLTEDLAVPHVATTAKQVPSAKTPLSGSRLTELSLVVDTGGAYKQEEYS